jgi:hypothetical protein
MRGGIQDREGRECMWHGQDGGEALGAAGKIVAETYGGFGVTIGPDW